MGRSRDTVDVVGGGLAGCEAAWQIAQRGVNVRLCEMRPGRMTPAHTSGNLGELVCSNSLGSDLVDRASGLLKAELRILGSLILTCADECRVPAGGALAVDRDRFALAVTQRVHRHPLIRVTREEVQSVPDAPAVIASGPLTSEPFAAALADVTGQEHLAFYDAVAPIVTAESVDMSIAFRASRYGRGGADYVNCPMTGAQYGKFVRALVAADRIPLRGFELEDAKFFEACLPVEVLAARGDRTLAFGPLRPTGLIDPRTDQRPYAVVQLRHEDMPGSAYNLVGFQTNLRYGEQKRVFRMIPGLERAEFLRLGQMHRNTFVRSPALLEPSLHLREQRGLLLAGQLTGTEGYLGSTASGCVAGVNAARHVLGRDSIALPDDTMIGALCRYVSQADAESFQPMKASFGLLPPLKGAVPRGRRARRAAMSDRALTSVSAFAAELQTRAGQESSSLG